MRIKSTLGKCDRAFFLASSVGAGFTTNLCHSPFTYINPPRSHPRCDRFIILVGYPKCELNPPWESAIASFPVIWVGLFFARLGWRGGGFYHKLM